MWARKSSRKRKVGRLAQERQKRRRLKSVVISILVLLLLGLVVWGLWQEPARISRIEVIGTDPAVASYAKAALSGSYFRIIPHDSTFFPPEGAIRSAILAEHPEIAALSIYHGGLNTLVIKAENRTPVARWCGLQETPGVAAYCYLFDPGGFIYAALPEPLGANASSTPTQVSQQPETLNPFVLYAPLAGNAEEPMRATIAHADALPSVFDFARKLSTLGSQVETITIHDTEVDDDLASGTRIMYVLGNEQDAYTALVSAISKQSLADGSLEYVDLRFPGKVYLKRKSN